MTRLDLADIVAVALGLGLATLAFRLALAELRGRWAMPAGVRAALHWVPVAALAAIVAPTLMPQGGGRATYSVLIAAAVAGVVAYRTRNLLLSVGLGMAAFWLAPG